MERSVSADSDGDSPSAVEEEALPQLRIAGGGRASVGHLTASLQIRSIIGGMTRSARVGGTEGSTARHGEETGQGRRRESRRKT